MHSSLVRSTSAAPEISLSGLRKAQFEYGNQMPPPISEDDVAESEGLEAHAEHLLMG